MRLIVLEETIDGMGSRAVKRLTFAQKVMVFGGMLFI